MTAPPSEPKSQATNPPPPGGGDGAPSHHQMADLAREWAAEIGQILDSRAQLTRRGLLATAAIAAAMLLVVGTHTLWMIQHDSSVIANPWPAFAGGVCMLVMMMVVVRSGSPRPRLTLIVYGVIAAMQIAAVAVNGLAAVLMVAATLTFSHVMLTPTRSLVLGVALIVFSGVALVSLHPETAPELYLRALGSQVSILLFMQLATRFWEKMLRRFHYLGREMSRVVAEMDIELNAAKVVDVESRLPNRLGFRLDATAWLAGEHAPAQALVVSLNLTKWQDSTASFGPSDQLDLLNQLVAQLRSGFGAGALLARSGAGEFWAMLPVTEGAEASAIRTLEILLADLQRPLTQLALAALTLPRMGFSRFPKDATDMPSLMRKAEVALRAAERTAAGRACGFHPSMEQQASDRTRLTRDISAAIKTDQFELFYQPILSAGGGLLLKAEGLIRWNHPQRGFLNPGQFIHLAEDSDLIVDLTEWVVRAGVSQVRQWRGTLDPRFELSVNLPPQYLMRCIDPNSELLRRLSEIHVPPGAIVLEITEGAMLNLTPEMLRALNTLREIGFQIALDDFGVGYSSFGQLEKLPLDYLKLDKSFVDGLQLRPQRRVVLEGIVQMAHALGFKIVAEGVELDIQREWLTAMRCDYLQGYLFSKPIPFAELEAMVKARSPLGT
jgi:EAL domain-containing protein (putative c-di-GMP-specific phosphodiesterase class I)/GGDEF domain-containing protein